ncbi:hypothetical protein ACPVPU_07270 [Sphingomonas sp. CJ99]
MSAGSLAAIYFAVLIAVLVVAKWQARREPTQHGRVVMMFFGFWLAVLWPLALIYFLVVLPILLIIRAVGR